MRALSIIFLLAPYLLNAQFNLQQIGHLSYDSTSLAGCWHYVDDAGGEYALVGTGKGLSIVDLNNPAQPVERFMVPGLPNNWREVKTWAGFAYVGSEAQGSGITIVDLRELPDTIYWKVWRGDGEFDSLVQRSHTVQAEAGYLYIFGGGVVTNGATIADLSDPWNPQIVGKYTDNYVHDGFIRGDTMWTSEIYAGQFGVVDISDKTNPQLIVTHPTPYGFNHNTGLSPDGKILYTTDEKPDAPLAAFDVSDLDNITQLDTYYPSQDPSREVHNVRVIGNFLVNPSYGGQLTIVDATRPDNLIETGFASLGTSLVWDADPYLPTGIIFATEKNKGLFVFQPSYQRAAYLEGQITDAATGLPLTNATVKIFNAPKVDSSGFGGFYKTGTGIPGVYAVEISKPGYFPQSFLTVTLEAGLVTILNAALVPEVTSVPDIANADGFRVFPNVVQEAFQLEIAAGSPFAGNGTLLKISDLSGKAILEMPLGGNRVTVSLPAGVAAGTYFIRLGNAGRWSGAVPVFKK